MISMYHNLMLNKNKNNSIPEKSIVIEPPWIKLIKSQAVKGEIGVGDTMERLIKSIGLDKFAQLYTYILKKNCGCKNRKDYYNKEYPY